MSEAEKKVVILVADDEPSTLALVAAHVRSRGYTVLEASDGDLAWQLAHEHLPDLVVLDVMMPGMSGWEVCRKIREAVSLAHTGVIMLTGIGENLNEMTSPLYGADSYLDKPFEFSVLDERIAEVLDARKKGAMGRPAPEVTAPERQNGMVGKVSAPSSRPPQGAVSRRATKAAAKPEKAAAPAAKSKKPVKAAAAASKPARKSAKRAKTAAKPTAARAAKPAAKAPKKATKKAAGAAKAAAKKPRKASAAKKAPARAKAAAPAKKKSAPKKSASGKPAKAAARKIAKKISPKASKSAASPLAAAAKSKSKPAPVKAAPKPKAAPKVKARGSTGAKPASGTAPADLGS